MLKIPAALASVIPKNAADAAINNGSPEIKRLESRDRQLRRWHNERFEPFDYQADVIRGLLDRGSRSKIRGLLLLPTGAGKTSTALATLLTDLGQLGVKDAVTLWIAPQLELLRQAADGLERIWAAGLGPNSIDIRFVTGSTTTPPSVDHNTFVFATPASARKFVDSQSIHERITHVIFDEAHHLGAQQFKQDWDCVTSSPNLRMALGLSATPDRGDEPSFELLSSAFEHRIFYPQKLAPDPIASLQEMGVLARVSVRIVDGLPAYLARNSASRTPTDTLTSDPEFWIACLNEVKQSNVQALTFCPERNSGRLFTAHLRSIGCEAEYVDGSEDLSTRLAALERFRDRRTRCVVSVNLLFEGIDLPNASLALLTYPIRSSVRLSQIVGRVIRGPRLGGASAATVLCSDVGTQRSIGDPNVSRDYLAYWRDGDGL